MATHVESASPARDRDRVALESVFPGDGEMAILMRRIDWSKTAVGPAGSWPQSLRTSVQICLTSRYPMFIAWGPEWTYFYNDAYRPILGTKHPRFLGGSLKECWTEIWEDIGPIAERVKATGRAEWFEDLLLVMSRNGYTEETYFTFSYSPLRDDENRIVGIFCACIETTDRVLQERRLHTLRDLTAEVGTVAEAGRKAAEVLARNGLDIPFSLLYLLTEDRKEALLFGRSDFGTAPDSIAIEGDGGPWPFRDVLGSGQAVRIDRLSERFDDLPRPHWPERIETAIVLPFTRPGHKEPTGFVVLGISPRRAFDEKYRAFFELVAGRVGTIVASARGVEDERKRAQALAELDLAKTAFFSNVSHEFRTPLTLLLGPLEDALRTAEGPLRAGIETAHRNALRLLKLVNTLLDFSRIESGRVLASFEPSDLSTLTQDLAGVFRSAVESAGMRLRVDCSPLPERVYVDPEMWEKIVFNLLSNAFKFTFEGEIAVVLRWLGTGVELEVSDTGTGIAAEELPKLFRRFHRIRGARGRSQEGSGIGLALVQELVKLHGGSIDVTSELGRGTSFRIRLPAGAGHLPPDRIGAPKSLATTAIGPSPFVDEASRWLAPDEASEVPPADPSRRVLVVDDNADMRSYVSTLLGRLWTVETAPDGSVALERIRANPPDLVLSDAMMPVLDGIQLLREIRRDSRLKDLPVILLSARAGEDATVDGLRAGADDYLTKPFSAKELVARVKTHLDLVAVRRSAQRTEERLRLITDALPALISYIDADGRYVLANKAYEDWFGRPVDDIRGRTMREVLGEAADEALRPYVERALAGERTTFEAEVPYRDAGTRWVRVSYIPDSDPGGAVKGLFTLVNDVTDLMRVERALRESEARFRSMADHSGVMVWVTEPDASCTFLSKSWYEFTGQTPETGLGKGWMQAIHPDDRDRAGIRLPAANARREEVRLEYRLRRSDGEYRWVLDSAVPRYGDDRTFLGYVGSVIDISERKRTEEEIRARVRERTAQLEETVRELDTFAYTVAHDLRAPLRAMHRYSDVLLEDYALSFGNEVREYLKRIGAGAERMDQLILDLLAYSRIARAEIRLQPVDLGEVIHRILSDLRVGNGRLRIEGTLPSVQGDPVLVMQCLTNLISNALKFTRPGQPADVTFGAERLGDRVRITVQDEGIGISPEHQERLFRLFERLNPSSYPGTGVGLAIVKKAVERMNGRVGLTSAPGRGSLFWIDLQAVSA